MSLGINHSLHNASSRQLHPPHGHQLTTKITEAGKLTRTFRETVHQIGSERESSVLTSDPYSIGATIHKSSPVGIMEKAMSRRIPIQGNLDSTSLQGPVEKEMMDKAMSHQVPVFIPSDVNSQGGSEINNSTDCPHVDQRETVHRINTGEQNKSESILTGCDMSLPDGMSSRYDSPESYMFQNCLDYLSSANPNKGDNTNPGLPHEYSDNSTLPETSTSVVSVSKHKVDNDALPYLCLECGISFSTESHLLQHARQHNEKNLRTKQKLKQIESPTKDVHAHPQKCHQASKSVESKQGKDKPFCCSYCDERFIHRTSWKRHETKHTGQRPYKCSECEKGYYTPSELNRHIQVVHKQERVTCNFCEKQFSYTHYLHAHIKEKHLTLSCPAVQHHCHVCNKGFPTPTRLRRHIMTHVVDKPFKCPQCTKSYTAASGLSQHMAADHSDAKSECEFCGKVFKYPQHLKSHIREKHKRDETTFIKCTYCMKMFPTLYRMRRHMTIHTGDKPHKCDYCSKSYLSFSGLKDHVRAIHDETKLTCSHCDKQFKYTQHLYAHTRDKHGVISTREGQVESPSEVE